MTLGDITSGLDGTSGVRGLISDTEYSESLIAQAANGFVNELCLNTNLRIMETEDDIYIAAGDTTAELPDDMKDMLNLIVTSPQVFDIRKSFVEYNDFMRRYPNYASATPMAVRQWTDFANGMRFAAPALTDTVIHIDYIRNPVDMVASDDTCEIPDTYRELIEHGTLARLMEINEDYQEASQERSNFAPLITAFIANEGRGQIKSGPTIMRTNRRRLGGAGNHADSYWG